MGCGAAEATGLGFVCFVVINSRVLSENRVYFGLLFHKFSNFTPPPPTHTHNYIPIVNIPQGTAISNSVLRATGSTCIAHLSAIVACCKTLVRRWVEEEGFFFFTLSCVDCFKGHGTEYLFSRSCYGVSICFKGHVMEWVFVFEVMLWSDYGIRVHRVVRQMIRWIHAILQYLL